MRPHPWIVALALLLVGVMAFGTTVISRHSEARRLRRLPLPDEPEPAPPPRARWFPAPSVGAPPRPAPRVPAPAPPRGVLRLNVMGPHGLRMAHVEAFAVHQGDPEETRHDFDYADEDEEGALTLAGLTPGRYDVAVEVPGMRPVHVEGVPTNGETVAIALERAPVLRGVARRGADARSCAAAVFVRGPGLRKSTGVDQQDCTFEIEDLPSGRSLEVWTNTSGTDPHTLVTIPLAGDPAFLCIGTPCDDTRASLAVYVADARGVQVENASLEWTLVGDETRGEIGNDSAPHLTYLHGRRPGETLQLRASVDGRLAETTVVVNRGVTDVVLTVPVAPEDGEDGEDAEDAENAPDQ